MLQAKNSKVSALNFIGIAGGGDYDHSGAASDYVCLPHDPNLITNTAIQNPWGESSFVYGGEYEENILGPKVFNNDVPCAVCYTTHQSVILMIPGKSKCYDGWKTEYFGKLVGGSNRAPSASQYACLDNLPEVLEHGSANENGKLFYAVRARCGSLPCPPYTNNALLTCVVCSK
ncbi:unnamed protein product [Mytilus edulis]|uniref:Short-chain collagen C4-like n=1 Tax=Mytilus edulis TaxID=6550 RepID=A0A8S3QXR2_MYTED|nr:unnamed protein product [Mytilus edulis]